MGLPPCSCRHTEYRPVMVRMPARIGEIFTLICRKAVTMPASIPASSPARMAPSGCPIFTNTVPVLMPSTMEPSTVRSGTFRIRKDMYTPSTMMP